MREQHKTADAGMIVDREPQPLRDARLPGAFLGGE